ncbi:Kdo hydroxylase family protein, partial [Acinetobacter nosocomialis]|uniref:Kdo hydroxylase family protein n=1 Tax=Acinetobacter nosocomialis TaxID=106654 RepID=UPI0033205DD7
NPTESRYWITSSPFHTLAQQFGGTAVPFFQNSLLQQIGLKAKKTARSLGFPIRLRSPYDQFMLQMHHFLKENNDFQTHCPKDYWDFPPNSCW